MQNCPDACRDGRQYTLQAEPCIQKEMSTRKQQEETLFLLCPLEQQSNISYKLMIWKAQESEFLHTSEVNFTQRN